MRQPKKLPPPANDNSPTATPSPASTEGQYDTARTIAHLENTLSHALPPAVALTPGLLGDMFEMVMSLAFVRRVTLDFWVEIVPRARRGVELAAVIEAEFRMSQIEGLTEEQGKIIASSIELSIQELKDIRSHLFEKLKLLKQCPNEGDKIH